MSQAYESTNSESMEGTNYRAKQVVTEVGQTAKDHVREVGDDVSAQTRHLAGEVRQRLTDEADTQSERLSTSLRQLSDDLGGMKTQVNDDSLAAAVVERLSEGSRQIADYLQRQGPDGVMREVREFARRKPGTFLLSAAFAGFVVGRLGKGILTGGSNGANGGSHSTSTMGEEFTRRPTATATAPVPTANPTTPMANPTTPMATPPMTPMTPMTPTTPTTPTPTPGRERR